MSANTLDDFKGRFDALGDYIDSTTKAATNDVLGNLSVLDKQVSDLCKDVKATGGQAAKGSQPFLADMIIKLDELATALQAYKARKEQEL